MLRPRCSKALRSRIAKQSERGASASDAVVKKALARIRPCRRRFARGLAPPSAPTRPGSSPDAGRNQGAARCREPLRPFEALPQRRRPQGRLGGRYPSVIARTGSHDCQVPRRGSYRTWCAGPNPSRRLRSPIPAGLRRLPPAPAGRRPFPALSPRSLHGCPDPYPAAPGRCTCPFLPDRLRPRPRTQKLGTPDIRRAATSHGGLHFGAAVIRFASDPRAR